MRGYTVKMENPYAVLKAPLSTEKAIRAIEYANTLTFEVHKEATKADIKAAVEAAFNVKVQVVRVNITGGKKKALVRLASENSASDVSAELGFI